MNDPARLHDAGTDDERRLIALGRHDRPPSDAVERALSVLGLAGAAMLAPTAARAATLATNGAATGSLAGTATSGTTVTLLSLAKWLVVGGLGGTLTVAAVSAPTWTKRAPATNPAVAGVPRSAIPPSSPLPSARPRETAPAMPSAVSAAPPVASGTPNAASAADSLAEELALLERTRSALARGRSDQARALLGTHRERFASPVLAEEADVLRIEVTFARGELDLAAQAAQDFLRARPSSPHAARIRALLSRSRSDPKAVEWPSSP